jgi:hypothetical protein
VGNIIILLPLLYITLVDIQHLLVVTEALVLQPITVSVAAAEVIILRLRVVLLVLHEIVAHMEAGAEAVLVITTKLILLVRLFTALMAVMLVGAVAPQFMVLIVLVLRELVIAVRPVHNLPVFRCPEAGVAEQDMAVAQEETPQPSIVITHTVAVRQMAAFRGVQGDIPRFHTYFQTFIIVLALAAAYLQLTPPYSRLPLGPVLVGQ